MIYFNRSSGVSITHLIQNLNCEMIFHSHKVIECNFNLLGQRLKGIDYSKDLPAHMLGPGA